MRKFILDTDIGADCDDVAAIYYLLGKAADGECDVPAITLCTARAYAPAAASAFLSDCKRDDIALGTYKGEPLACDNFDNYAEAIAKSAYKAERAACAPKISACEDAVALMRKTLAQNDKTEIICIGPACNVAKLLQSGADEYSAKTGEELVKERAGKLYIMGGAFEFGGEKPFAEWNIEQDVESAKFVFEKYPNEIVVCPSETGGKVATVIGVTRSLLNAAMTEFFKTVDKNAGINFTQNAARTRPSWDPLTCMVALYENSFNYSARGNVTVGADGITRFTASESGKHAYLTVNNDFAKTEKSLNEYLKNLW